MQRMEKLSNNCKSEFWCHRQTPNFGVDSRGIISREIKYIFEAIKIKFLSHKSRLFNCQFKRRLLYAIACNWNVWKWSFGGCRWQFRIIPKQKKGEKTAQLRAQEKCYIFSACILMKTKNWCDYCRYPCHRILCLFMFFVFHSF